MTPSVLELGRRVVHRTLFSVFGLALLLGGCPKRQTAPRLVYVTVPPQAVETAPAGPSQTLVIEEPPLPPALRPPETPAAGAVAPRPAHRPRRADAGEPAAASEAPPEPDAPTPTVGVPALEPRSSREQESALRGQILGLQNDVQQQIAALEPVKLGSADRKTLDDAQTFLVQSRKALEEGDLQRSLTLARKASLLVAALKGKS